MGFDKQFLRLGELRLLDIIIEKLEREFDEIIIITNKPEEYSKYDYLAKKDIIPGKGPLSGIHSGLLSASSKYSFVIGCDMPNINLEYIGYMKERISKDDIDGCITIYDDWIEPFYGFYSKEIVKEIEDYLSEDKRAIYPLMKKLNIEYIEENIARRYSPNWEIFINLNTREDIDRYLNKIKAFG